MRPRGGGRGERHRRGSAFLLLLLAASARLYGALLVLYPKAFRLRYSEEMRRDFRELMREGLEEGGAKELVRVWVQALTDLVLTALKERSTMPAARNAYYVPVDPTTATRAMVRAMVAVVFVAVVVTMASLLQPLTYEASTEVWVGDQQTYVTGSGEEIQTLPSPGVELQALFPTITHAIDSRPVAEEAIRRLGFEMSPEELLDNLAIEHVEGTNFMRLTYEDTNPYEAAQIVNTVGEVSSDRISETRGAGGNLTANVYLKARVQDNPTPVSPNPLRNGLLTLVTGLVLCAGLALALPRPLAARVAGTLGGRVRVRPFGELIEVLGRGGKLTAVEAALESSLSVEEAEGMLQALAAKGHIEVTVEHGRLVYALWERAAPP
jgi:capsular polysaccharide biosynthesis protein